MYIRNKMFLLLFLLTKLCNKPIIEYSIPKDAELGVLAMNINVDIENEMALLYENIIDFTNLGISDEYNRKQIVVSLKKAVDVSSKRMKFLSTTRYDNFIELIEKK